MTLAIAATPSGPGQVILSVTGAASMGATAYSSNFASTVDSWTGGSGGTGTPTLTAPVTIGGVTALRIGSLGDFHAADQYAQRTVTGLTPGFTYRVGGSFRATAPGVPLCYIGVSGIGTSDGVALVEAGWQNAQYDFVATGTSHVIRITRSTGVDSAGVYAYGVKVLLLTAGTLNPCTIQRQDANGNHYVRLADGQDVDGAGDMTVTDNECAIYGTGGADIRYIVRDGLGASAQTTTTLYNPAAIPLLSQVGLTVTVDVPRVNGWDEAWEYAQQTTNVKTVIGRGDAIVVNSDDYGWTKRQGTLNLYAATYADARTIANTYIAGRVMLLRQPTYGNGFDLYHASTRVKINPSQLIAAAPSGKWQWQVDVDYVEVANPDGPLVGTEDWTWDALVARYLSWADVVDGFATWADVATDNPL